MCRTCAVVLVLFLLGAAPPLPSPTWRRLSPKDRQDLEAKWKEQSDAGHRLSLAGRLDEAAKAFTESLTIARKLYPQADYPVGHGHLADSMGGLGLVLRLQGKYAEAERLLRDALATWRRLYPNEAHKNVATGLNNMASLLHDKGALSEAESTFREALSMRQRLFPKADHKDVAQSLNNLGNVVRDRGRFVEAERLFRDALATYERIHSNADHASLVSVRNNLGVLLRFQGRYREAEPHYREALAMSRRLHRNVDHPDVALSLNNLGMLLRFQGEYAEAEVLLREALTVRQRMFNKADHPDLPFSLNNLGFILEIQGKVAEAETYYREALVMRQRIYRKADHINLAVSLNNLGFLLQSQGNYAEAEPYFREALLLRRRLFKDADHPSLAVGWNNLGYLLRAQGQYAKAEPYIRKALEMRRRLYQDADHPDLVQSLGNLGGLFLFTGKYAEAEAFLRDALVMEQRLYPNADHPDLVKSHLGLGIVRLAQGNTAQAERLFRDALAISRRTMESYAVSKSEGETLTLAASLPVTLDFFLSSTALGRSKPDLAYTEVWHSKAAMTRVFERRGFAARAASSNEKAGALLAELTDARRRRAELLLAPQFRDVATQKKREEDIKVLSERVAQLDRAVRPLLPAIGRADQLAKAAPSDLQKSLPADAAVIDFLAYTHFTHDKDKPGKAGEKRTPSYLAFVLTRDKVSRIELGPAKPMEDAIRVWRDAITGSAPRVPGDVPARVRQLVWDKVRNELPAGVKTVYLSPDLALTALPWAALPGDKPGTILLEDYALAVVPHAPFLLDKLWPDNADRRKPGGLLALGGVAYADGPATKPDDRLALSRSSPAVDKPLNWKPLPGAAAEAKGVATLAKARKLSARLLTGTDASADRVLAELPQARFAHLATHGFFADPKFRSVLQIDPKLFETRGGERVGAGALSPMVMSGLVFAGANKPDTPGRGLLTGEALIDRDLSGLELAVLSACETGLGDTAGGEGVFGLQRAFHVAGARNVVASLWKVDDAATAALMAAFYRRLWRDNLPPIEALRQAQLEVYRNPGKVAELAKALRAGFEEVEGSASTTEAKAAPDGKAHPRLWAAFLLSGPGSLRPPPR